MICKNCGANIESNAKFCTNCGKTLEQSTQENVQQQVVNNTSTQQVYQQPVKKKDNTLWIVLGIVGGVLFLGFVAMLGFFFVVYSAVRNIDDYDYYDDYDYDYDEPVEEIEDPTGHTISIYEDDIYIYRVDTDYLYDLQDELKEKAKIASPSSVDSLSATDAQKKATKKVIELLDDEYLTYSRNEIVNELKSQDYDDATIKYALEHCGADWEERAVIDGLTFLAVGGTSKEELTRYLKNEGYSDEIVNKTVNSKYYDYYEQAVYDACFYRFTEEKYSGGYTREKAEEALKRSGYTDKEVIFALKVAYEQMADY